jgi:hypothetical protein
MTLILKFAADNAISVPEHSVSEKVRYFPHF